MDALQIAEILKLDVQERLRLLQLIWESIAEQPDALEVDADEAAELDRRLAEYRANPTAGLSWDEVKAQILSRR